MPDLRVESICVDRLPDVYPLVRSATRVTLDRWKEFGRELLEAGGGILAVSAPDDCIHGVAAYRPNRNLRHEQSLEVEVIVAFELSRDDRIREILCRNLERIASERGCSTVNFTVAGKNANPNSPSRSGLERMGLKLDTASFIRELPGAEG